MHYSSVRQLLFGFLLVVFITACERDTTPSALPQIFKMSITGIPDEDITIDEPNRQITVLLPASLSTLQITPTFQLTKGAGVIGVPIDFSAFCPCSGPFSVSEIYKVPFIVHINDSYRVVYEVTLKQKKPLKLIASSQLIVIEANSNPTHENPLLVYLPVENYFGSSSIRAISVSKVGQVPNWIGGDACFNLCPAQLNKIGIALDGYRGSGALTPGEYDVQLRLGNGSILKYPQPIIIK